MTDRKTELALERVRAARADYEAKQDDVQAARDRYYSAVQALTSSGMTLREVADALGLSHQRVHQMIQESEGGSSKLRRGVRKASKAGGIAVLLALLVASATWLKMDRDVGPLATPTRVASVGESPQAGDERHSRTRNPEPTGPACLKFSHGRAASKVQRKEIVVSMRGRIAVKGPNIDFHAVRCP